MPTAGGNGPGRDFSRASMVRLVLHWLERCRPELLPADGAAVDAVRRAHHPAGEKRALLETIRREAGAAALLSIGQGLRDVGYDPLFDAALRSASPEVFFEKWARVEAFSHARNRLKIEPSGKRAAAFTRYTLDGGTPSPAENLLICGFMIALLEQIGCQGLCCDMPLDDGSLQRIRREGRFSLPPDETRLATRSWSIGWQAFVQRSEDRPSELGRLELPVPSGCDPALRKGLESVAAILLRDVSRPWKVAELAREAGLSARTLQRRLGEAELSVSRLVRLTRIHEACRLLELDDVSITTIGFCAGFSDSAHFSRDFRASMGMTPSDYRALHRRR